MLKICAFSRIYIAKSGRLCFLCAYFFLQRLYVLIFEQKRLYVLFGHVLIKNEGTEKILEIYLKTIGIFIILFPF